MGSSGTVEEVSGPAPAGLPPRQPRPLPRPEPRPRAAQDGLPWAADEVEISLAALEEALDRVMAAVRVSFRVDDVRETVVIRVLDAETGEVLREITMDSLGGRVAKGA